MGRMGMSGPWMDSRRQIPLLGRGAASFPDPGAGHRGAGLLLKEEEENVSYYVWEHNLISHFTLQQFPQRSTPVSD